MRLKLGIVAAGKSQRQVAAETQLLTENRLSEIVCGWIEPGADEKEALARVLDQPVEQLFDESPLEIGRGPDPELAPDGVMQSRRPTNSP
jgi:transcriptional regulator with XRE-family HTH domain